MGLTVDFTGVQDGFALVPEGTYPAVVYDIEVRNSKTSGAPYLNWQLKIQGGDNDNQSVFFMTSLQPKALFSLKRVLKNLRPNMDLDGLADLDLEELKSLPCRVVVVHEMYNNEKQARVKNILGAEDASMDSMLSHF